MVKFALTPTDSAKIEAKDRKSAVCEGMVKRIDDLVVHRPTVLRMGMKDQRNGRILCFSREIAPFKAALWAIEIDFWHNAPCRNTRQN